MVRNKISQIDSRKHANHSFITEGIPWKLHLTIGIYRKTTGTTFPLYKKERERRSRPTRTLVKIDVQTVAYSLHVIRLCDCTYNDVQLT